MPGTPAVRLEPVGEEHLPEVARLIADPDVLRFSRTPEPVPPGFERVWLDRVLAGRAEGRMEVFAAFDAETGAFVGMGLVPLIERDAAQAELGYSVLPEARGRGVATAILRALTRWAFDEAGIRRATLIIDVGNPASERVAERAGYVREGVMRSIHQKGDRRVDAGLWSRLPTDPEPPQ
jgi:RimJ/RimL family protein N-acetyltransferase